MDVLLAFAVMALFIAWRDRVEKDYPEDERRYI